MYDTPRFSTPMTAEELEHVSYPDGEDVLPGFACAVDELLV